MTKKINLWKHPEIMNCKDCHFVEEGIMWGECVRPGGWEDCELQGEIWKAEEIEGQDPETFEVEVENE